MSEAGSRSVAEKLAAAKKKHKAYLKEKGLKNGNKIKEQVLEDPLIYTENTTEPPIQNLEISNENENITQTQDIYEADLPLPQYPMNYETQPHGSSLPDPLSFFDNFSNVGATFQNFTQPLTSFFNNNSSNNSDTNEVVELPNQILVDESIPFVVSSENVKVTNNQNFQEIFSYDKFKNDAVKKIINTKKPIQEENIQAQLLENQVFDEFTNSNPRNDFPKLESSFAHDNIPSSFQNNFQENTLNAFEIPINGIQENTPFLLEIKPELENSNKKIDVQTLQEISNEMDELLNQNKNLQTKSIESLEKQNKELTSLFEQQNAKCFQLSSQLQESEIRYSKLLTEFRTMEIKKEDSETTEKLTADLHMQNEVSKLREDLQCHLQTISMLVAEKTELSALLHETQSTLNSESSKLLDLQNQMKEMKLYYSNFEHEFDTLKSEKLISNSTHKEQADMFNKITQDYNEMKNRHEEVTQDLLEAKEKLKAANENNTLLQKQVNDLSSQLSLANIKIQQLTVGGSIQLENQIEKLTQEKFAHEKQISILNDTLKTISKEREESSLQYQQYAEQLNGQITNLVSKLEQYQKENEQLKIQEENRIKHIGDLEKQLQNVKSDNTCLNLQKNNSSLKKELETSIELVKNLQIEKDEMNANLTKALIDKEMLEKELESCKFSISQLETSVEQLKGSQPDNAVLLATMESDKVAASRAISQNNELKKQMEGMQEVLLKVNNDNVELTESVSLERRTNKDLLEKLQKTEINFQTLTSAIEIKDRELTHLRDQLEKLTKQSMQQEQLSDRLRHYEAQDHSSPSLQNELQDAKQMIAHLTNELNILKQNQLNQSSQTIQPINENSDVEELKTQLNNLRIRNEELESLLSKSQFGEQKNTDTNGNENLDKETAMKHLEKKFLRTMEEIAKLTEEKQRLEHLVLQLQGETETIGAYVTLYQQQRAILKQRAIEKDQQLQQLTNDREVISANLDRLNNLVNKLIVEKGAITKELLEEHHNFSKERSDLCAEHQKIHKEINKITSDSLQNSSVSDNPNTQIAEEIITLLSEIKSSNLVQSSEGIHHCPWCSGKLITV